MFEHPIPMPSLAFITEYPCCFLTFVNFSLIGIVYVRIPVMVLVCSRPVVKHYNKDRCQLVMNMTYQELINQYSGR